MLSLHRNINPDTVRVGNTRTKGTLMAKPEGLSPEEVMDKITKLLAKAESTTPEEAAAITEHAERLMAKYSIDQAVLNSRRAATGEVINEKITRWRFEFTGTYHRGLLYTFEKIASALDFKVMFTRGNNWSSMTIMGFESDIENGKLLISSLQLQLTAALTEWWKTYDGKAYMTPMEKFKARRSFMYAFANGVQHRVWRSKKQLITESEQITPGTALAVRDRNKILSDAYDALDIDMVKIKMDITDFDAEINGYEAGRNANTGEDRLGSTPAIEA